MRGESVSWDRRIIVITTARLGRAENLTSKRRRRLPRLYGTCQLSNGYCLASIPVMAKLHYDARRQADCDDLKICLYPKTNYVGAKITFEL